MKFFGFISASVIAAESSPVPFEFDDSEFYGLLQKAKQSGQDDVLVTAGQCCSTLKVWGDIALFSGRFDKSEELHDDFPVYRATSGDLKLFYNSKVSRWVVSNELGNKADLRAFGENTPCPDNDYWMVWNGERFEQPDLIEPWSPYVDAPKLFECRPETFKASDLSSAISEKLCDLLTSSDPVHSTRYCREGEKVVQLAFADWENATDNFLNSNMLMTVYHVHNLDQWHATLNSIILKRTWDMEDKVISSIQSYLRQTVNDIKSMYHEEEWAQDDHRFLFLRA